VEVPATAGVTDPDPLVGSAPDQSDSFGLATAVQDVALVLDHVSVSGRPAVVILLDANMLTVGMAALVPLLPPHALRRHKLQTKNMGNGSVLITLLQDRARHAQAVMGFSDRNSKIPRVVRLGFISIEMEVIYPVRECQ
jgi:hypothetical protein